MQLQRLSDPRWTVGHCKLHTLFGRQRRRGGEVQDGDRMGSTHESARLRDDPQQAELGAAGWTEAAPLATLPLGLVPGLTVLKCVEGGDRRLEMEMRCFDMELGPVGCWSLVFFFRCGRA